MRSITDSVATAVDAALLIPRVIRLVDAVREMRCARLEWEPYADNGEGQEKIRYSEAIVDELMADLVPDDECVGYWLRGASDTVQRIMDGYAARERELMENLLESNLWISRALYYLGPTVPLPRPRQHNLAVALERLAQLAELRKLVVTSARRADRAQRDAASVRLGRLVDQMQRDWPWLVDEAKP